MAIVLSLISAVTFVSCEREIKMPKELEEMALLQDVRTPTLKSTTTGFDGSLESFDSSVPSYFTTITVSHDSNENYSGSNSGSAHNSQEGWHIGGRINFDNDDEWGSLEYSWAWKSVSESARTGVSIHVNTNYGERRYTIDEVGEDDGWQTYSCDVINMVKYYFNANQDWRDLEFIEVYFQIRQMTTQDPLGDCEYWVDDCSYTTTSLTKTSTPTISGDNSESVCDPSSHIETFTATTGHNDYDWTVTGGTITSGQGTSTITVSFSAAGTKTITCQAKDTGKAWSEVTTHNYTLSQSTPSTPSVSGPTSTGYWMACTYTVSSGKYDYDWEITGGLYDIYQGGDDSNSVVLAFSSSGPITVKCRYKDCSSGVYSSFGSIAVWPVE